MNLLFVLKNSLSLHHESNEAFKIKPLKMKTTTKQMHVELTEKNTNWVTANLDAVDYKVLAGIIVIFYKHDFQKNDIINALGI